MAAGALLSVKTTSRQFTLRRTLGRCPWLYIVPAVTAIADAFLTANQGLNNAAQKPLVAHDIARRG